MASFSVRKFNWVRNPKTWERNEVWRARQQEARAQFESANSSASSAFASATINQVAGLGAIAARAASNRNQQQAFLNQLNRLV